MDLRIGHHVAFAMLFAVVALLTFWLVRPYLDIIAFSLMSVIVLKPFYDRIMPFVGRRRGVATALTVALFILAVLIPLGLALGVVISQVATLIGALSPRDVPLSDHLRGLSTSVQQIDLPFLQQALPRLQSWSLETATSFASLLAAFMLGLGASVPDMIARIFIFGGIVGSLLPNYHAFAAWLRRVSPLDDAIDSIFLTRIKITVRSMFTGIFVIAVAQGLTTGLLFWVAGVPYSPLLTLLAVIASMFPLGASIVALPVGLYLLVTSQFPGALIIILGYVLIVSNIDTVLRPRLIPREASLSFSLVLLSALGGYTLFGFFGVVYGPVLMIVFLTCVEIYEKFYAPRAVLPPQEAVATPAEPAELQEPHPAP